jgi:hypothetical protein
MNAEQELERQPATDGAGSSRAASSTPRPKTGLIFGIAVLTIAALAAFMMLRPGDDAKSGTPSTSTSKANASGLIPLGSATEHPLAPALVVAEKVKKNIEDNVQDYTATIYKQERYLGFLRPLETCTVKIRSKPFSAYMKFSSPENLKGQEAIYVEGANDGKLVGHAGSGVAALLGAKWLEPNGPIAMLNQRYPITELGVENLVRRLIEVGTHDEQFGECSVWQNNNAMVGDRPCISFTVLHPEKRSSFIFHIARIFVDKELQVPLHYEAYDWPDNPGDPPKLLERYTYANLKTNVGLTDADFDPRNPEYGFGLK